MIEKRKALLQIQNTKQVISYQIDKGKKMETNNLLGYIQFFSTEIFFLLTLFLSKLNSW